MQCSETDPASGPDSAGVYDDTDNEFCDPASEHHQDGIAFFCAQKEKRTGKQEHPAQLQGPLRETDNAVLKQHGQEDRQACRKDHGDNGGAQGLQDRLHCVQTSVPGIGPGQHRDEQAGGEDDAQGGAY